MQNKVYAQVYSMIRTFSDGLLDALKYFSEVGYDGVELIGSDTEGKTVDEFIEYLKELNLDAISVRERTVDGDTDFAVKVGARYIIGDAKSGVTQREELKEVCRELNQRGQELKKRGLKLVLHNHCNELAWVDGEEGKMRVYDFLLQETDPELVGFELDTGWLALAGLDCSEYIRNYPGRFPLIHVKECSRVASNPEELEHFPKSIFNGGVQRNPETGVPILTEEMKSALYEFRNWNKELGKGIINWPELIELAEAQGCEAYITEREYYHYEGSDGTAACCVKLDYDYLRSL